MELYQEDVTVCEQSPALPKHVCYYDSLSLDMVVSLNKGTPT